ncbi:hypothetical protein ACFL6X_04000 [Candidatus Latescibacterota bacterium]
MPAVTLDSGRLRTVIDTDLGTSIMACALRRGGDWLPLMPDVHLGLSELRWASFLMAPYSNRIADGRFTFAGREHQLANAEQHAIHGDVRDRPWEIEDRTPSRLVCRWSSPDCEGVNWPWPFEVRAEYEVAGLELRQRLVVWNRGDEPMPAGCGWHPYFSRQLTPDDGEVRLCLQAEGAYPDAHDTRIPSGPPEAPAPHQDFGQERALDPESFLDTCFCGYDGRGHIHWPGTGVRLDLCCSESCSHLILYNPEGTPHFAVEPVTNANDGVNLLARRESTAGTVALDPGEALEADFALVASLD